MLVIGGVERARGQDHDRRLAAVLPRRDRAQAGEQLVGIIVDRRDAMAREQVGQEPHRHFAVFQHVGDARRRARVVFEDVEFLSVDPHDVDAGDMHPDVVRRALADHLRPIEGIAHNQFGRDDQFLENGALSVDILEEQVERPRALREASLEPAPFRPRYETRNDVERDQPLGGVLVAIDAEGDADAPEHVFGLGAARGEQFGRRFIEPASDLAIERPRLAGGNAHLVERRHTACLNLIAWRRQARTTLRLGGSCVATSVPCRERAEAPRRRS